MQQFHLHNPVIMHLESPKLPVLMMITIFLFLIIPLATSLSFDYNGFSPDDADIKYEQANVTNNAIQLTNLNIASFGRAIYAVPMQLGDKASGTLSDFTTHFSFIIDSQNKTTYADGIAFFLAPVDSKLPQGGINGSSFGITVESKALNSTDHPFVAVEFDIYQNPGDPIHDHVGIDINSVKSVNNITWWSSIPDGKKNDAWINYDSNSKNLSVVFTGFVGNTIVQQELYCIVDLRDYLPEWVMIGFSAATGAESAIQSILSWNFNSTLLVHQSKGSTKWWIIVGVTLGVVGWVAFVVSCIWKWILLASWKWRNRRPNRNESEREPKELSFMELALATHNFAPENIIGQGGFGGVYRGYLRQFNALVAVKKKSRDSEQGIREYESEVKTISRLRFRSLVKLIGWCNETAGLFGCCRKEKTLLLVYEFMSNGSLYSHLFNENSLLRWAPRYRIAQDLASALLYLHEEWEPNRYVVHRDIKSNNVMLDSDFNAKLGDFGLARVVNRGQQLQTSIMAGTIDYMAPECLNGITSSKESDVYSFGIVALEIATGKKPNGTQSHTNQRNIVNWVRENYRMGNLMGSADRRLGDNFDEQQMERLLLVGLWCANPDDSRRPSIREVVLRLNSNETSLPELPMEDPVPLSTATLLNSHVASTSSVHAASPTSTSAFSISSPTTYFTAVGSTQVQSPS